MRKSEKDMRIKWLKVCETSYKDYGGIPGKMPWPDAYHLYNQGDSPITAGKKIALTQKKES